MLHRDMDRNSDDEYFMLEEVHDVYPEINIIEKSYLDTSTFEHDDKRSVMENKLLKLDLDMHRV